MNHSPDLSILLVSYNCKQYLLGCLASIYRARLDLTCEVIIVDNASADGTVEAVQEQFPQAALIANAGNPGLAAATNQALARSSGRYVLYLNPDTEVSKETLEGVVRFADAQPKAAAFCCRLLNDDGSLQHSCFRFPNLRMAFYGFFPLVPMDSEANGRYPTENYQRVFEPEHVLGAFLLVRREVIEQLGAWDEGFFMYFEETDFCYRLKRAGHTTLYTPDFSLVHYGGRSTSQVSEKMSVAFFRSQSLYYRKNYGLPHYLALKGIVLLGVTFWAVRSLRSYLCGRISAALLKTRFAGYLRILVA